MSPAIDHQMLRRDKDLQRIVEKAEREAARSERAARRRNRVDREPASEPELDPKRFGVYWHMHDGGSMFPWIIALGGVPMIVIAIDHTKIWYAVLGSVALLALRVAVLVLGAVRGHAKYKRFPADLKVTLEGWSRMLDDKSMLNDASTWQQMAVLEVTLAPDADQALVEAALELALPSMNRCFYGSSFSGYNGDPRDKWTRDGLRVTGSINICVLGALYRLIGKLDWIERRAGGISRIRISKSGSRHKLESDVSGGD